ncbi:MAG: MBL fold metallo-hydrolase, partial [Desulfobacteraceae bacterium]|nr:MBL fold metallo-hydrolase [Desulfobacteraceae bacterium]
MAPRKDGRFANLAPAGENTFFDFLRWRLGRLRKRIPGPEAYHFPLAANNPAFLAANRAATTCTWIGHATLLLQLAGRNLLTDPQFSARAFPVQWAGPRRVVPPGLALEALPPIDLVLITHDHYDSLDRPSIERLLARRGGGDTLFAVPLGVGKLLRSWGVTPDESADGGDYCRYGYSPWPLYLRDGTLVKEEGASAVYAVADGVAWPIDTWDT